MAWSIDARIPVRFGALDEAAPTDILIVEGDAAHSSTAAEHFKPSPSPSLRPAACACCEGRLPAAVALDRLFQRRARGEVPFFRAVVAVTRTEAGDLEIWAALNSDPLVSARFRLADAS